MPLTIISCSFVDNLLDGEDGSSLNILENHETTVVVVAAALERSDELMLRHTSATWAVVSKTMALSAPALTPTIGIS